MGLASKKKNFPNPENGTSVTFRQKIQLYDKQLLSFKYIIRVINTTPKNFLHARASRSRCTSSATPLPLMFAYKSELVPTNLGIDSDHAECGGVRKRRSRRLLFPLFMLIVCRWENPKFFEPPYLGPRAPQQDAVWCGPRRGGTAPNMQKNRKSYVPILRKSAG